MYNSERARPLFVWNVDDGSQGAASFSNCWRTETSGAADGGGNQTRSHPLCPAAGLFPFQTFS